MHLAKELQDGAQQKYRDNGRLCDRRTDIFIEPIQETLTPRVSSPTVNLRRAHAHRWPRTRKQRLLQHGTTAATSSRM